MSRFMMVCCAAALVMGAAVYAQVAPPLVAPAPAPSAAPAQETRDATTQVQPTVPAPGAPAGVTVWIDPVERARDSSGAPVAGSDVLVPTPPASPWNPSVGVYPVPTAPGYRPPAYSTTWVNPPATSAVQPYWPGNGQPVMVEPSTGRPVDAETVELMTSDRNLSVMINNQAASYKGLDDDAKRVEAEKQLTKMVWDQFEIRQKLRAKQLAALEDQLKRLRKLHDDRAAQRDRIVNDRVQQVLRDATGLGWGDVGGVGFEYAPFNVKVDGKPTAPMEVGAKRRRTETLKLGAPGGPVTVESSETVESDSDSSASADAK